MLTLQDVTKRFGDRTVLARRHLEGHPGKHGAITEALRHVLEGQYGGILLALGQGSI